MKKFKINDEGQDSNENNTLNLIDEWTKWVLNSEKKYKLSNLNPFNYTLKEGVFKID